MTARNGQFLAMNKHWKLIETASLNSIPDQTHNMFHAQPTNPLEVTSLE